MFSPSSPLSSAGFPSPYLMSFLRIVSLPARDCPVAVEWKTIRMRIGLDLEENRTDVHLGREARLHATGCLQILASVYPMKLNGF